MASLFEQLKQRGLVQDSSHPKELTELLASRTPAIFYCGFDPTSDSLHVGNMAALCLMRRLQRAGHKPIVLLGAATGMIGDPSGKSEERKLLTEEEIQRNLTGIEKPVKLFLSSAGANGVELVRNDSWIRSFSYIDFLREIGKHFSVNMMMAKESVKQRLENREQGISYTEFSYMLIQAYDYLWLYQNRGCRLQIGGSDQWGNITAGIDLIRRKTAAGSPQPFGFTYPLITTKSGAKFGKTESGAVWMDGLKTSPYQFYQFWLNTPDEEIIHYCRIFSEMESAEIDQLAVEIKTRPEERTAQKRLACELTTLIHGSTEADKAVAASAALFGQPLTALDSATLRDMFREVPSTELSPTDLGQGIPLQEFLVRVGVSKSKGDARRLIEGGGVYVNNERATSPAEVIDIQRFIEGSTLVIRTGKRNYHLVRLG